MDEKISYPFEEMNITAGAVHKEIDTFLPTHTQILNTIMTLDGLFPQSAENTFVEHIKSWKKNVEDQYAALYTLADTLKQGSHTMAGTDHGISQTFEPQQ